MEQVGNSQRNQYRLNADPSKSAVRRRWQRLTAQVADLRAQVADLRNQNQQLSKEVSETREQLEFTQAQMRDQAAMHSATGGPQISRERPMPGHQFGVTLIATAIELAKRVGFRAAEDALTIVFDWLQIEQKVPSHDVIEQWTLRLGVAGLQETFTKEDRVLWMADHSSQIGKEKLLLIVGVALADLPSAGETLQFEKMKVLAMVPGESWKKADVEREYRKLAERIGPPVYLLCDGASELRDPAETLEKDGKKTIVLGDLKHHAANVLEKEIGRTDAFRSFMSQIGLTRNRVQQTQLSHFAPPPIGQKSRFMNLGPLLRWAAMVQHHLDDGCSDARHGISQQQMEEKFGWLRQFSTELFEWRDCQEVIDCSLTVINSHCLDRNTSALVASALDQSVPRWQSSNTPASRIGTRLLEWISESASTLPAGERAWLSTEILESLFGRFKQLERQHSKGGFTRLIAALPTLCVRVTGSIVRTGFQRVNSAALRAWLSDTLGRTLTARRNTAYQESRTKIRCQELSPS